MKPSSISPSVIGFSVERAARLFTFSAAGVIAFQLALVSGAPWGAFTQGGGSPGVLAAPARTIAAASAVLLAGMIVIIRARAGLLQAPWATRRASLAWLVVAYCALGVIANAATPSVAERTLWFPVVAIMLACSLRVARGITPTVPRAAA